MLMLQSCAPLSEGEARREINSHTEQGSSSKILHEAAHPILTRGLVRPAVRRENRGIANRCRRER